MINPTEQIDVIDENDTVIQSLPRQQVHKQMLLHRLSHIWVINSKGQVLCQKRSPLKDRWPSMWECWFGGHLLAGTGYLDTAVAETKEELGLEIEPQQFELFGKRTASTAQENVVFSVYALKRDIEVKDITYEVEEVELLKWFEISELKAIYRSEDKDWVSYGYQLEMLDWLGSRLSSKN